MPETIILTTGQFMALVIALSISIMIAVTSFFEIRRNNRANDILLSTVGKLIGAVGEGLTKNVSDIAKTKVK